MKTYYFTFGQVHIHEYNGKILDKDIVVEIESISYSTAREKMFNLFGDKWFTGYQEKPDMSYFPRGVIKI